MNSLSSWFFFIVVVILWGSNWAVMKSGLGIVGPLNFVTQRFFLASLALSLLPVRLRGRIPWDRGIWLKLVVVSVINAAGILFTNIGLVYEKSGISAMLTYTQPLFVFCLAVLFLREEGGSRRLLGVIIGFFGVAVLYLGRDLSVGTLSYPAFLLFLGAFFWAISTVYYKRFLSHVNPVVTNMIQFGLGAILLSIPTLVFEGFCFNITSNYVLLVLYMSVCASAIGSTLWIFLVSHEEAIVVSASSFIVPVFALISGWVFLHETIELGSAVGSILILAGVYVVNKG